MGVVCCDQDRVSVVMSFPAKVSAHPTLHMCHTGAESKHLYMF
jgi:hypothetical protein